MVYYGFTGATGDDDSNQYIVSNNCNTPTPTPTCSLSGALTIGMTSTGAVTSGNLNEIVDSTQYSLSVGATFTGMALIWIRQMRCLLFWGSIRAVVV